MKTKRCLCSAAAASGFALMLSAGMVLAQQPLPPQPKPDTPPPVPSLLQNYKPVTAERLRAYFDYIKANENRLWVATFQDGGKYIRERMKSSVTTRDVGQAIEVSVTHTLDPKLYDLPLTARTIVPAQWTSARVRQGSATRTVPVQRDGVRSYVTHRIVPNAGPSRLERGE